MMCRNAVRWVYRLERNFSWESALPFDRDRAYRDRRGTVRLVLERGGRITVMRGYAWNGCSPKVCLFDILVGTPDGVVSAVTGRPKSYYASLVHDALYQFMGVGASLPRAEADRCFLRLLAESDFLPRYVYWTAVRALGWLVWSGKRRVRRWRGEAVDLAGLLGQAG